MNTKDIINHNTKSRLSIIAFLIVPLLCAFTLQASSQQDSLKKYLTANGKIRMDSAYLIADETTIEYVSRFAIIHCYNDSIARLIKQKWEQLIYGTHYEKSTGTVGNSIHYTFYLNKDDAQYIVKWFKTNL